MLGLFILLVTFFLAGLVRFCMGLALTRKPLLAEFALGVGLLCVVKMTSGRRLLPRGRRLLPGLRSWPRCSASVPASAPLPRLGIRHGSFRRGQADWWHARCGGPRWSGHSGHSGYSGHSGRAGWPGHRGGNAALHRPAWSPHVHAHSAHRVHHGHHRVHHGHAHHGHAHHRHSHAHGHPGHAHRHVGIGIASIASIARIALHATRTSAHRHTSLLPSPT
mmetsp:Transcript_69920/g.166919  ORF Transcript_69920/g.166919 Transcript_69920/m.166919 type:complete len:220 (+) Transcript_69920:1353-2012(+)